MTPRVRSLTVALAVVVWAAGFAQACRGEREASSGAGARSGANATPAAQAYVPSSTFQEIMDSVVDPAADYVWESVSYRATLKGVTERRPRTDADWHQLRQHAIVLVEAANLISVPGRKVAATNKMVEDGAPLDVLAIQRRLDASHDSLVAFANGLRNVGQQLVDAANRHDVDAITDLGGTLDEACEACHRTFWYPDEPPPPGGPAKSAGAAGTPGKK